MVSVAARDLVDTEAFQAFVQYGLACHYSPFAEHDPEGEFAFPFSWLQSSHEPPPRQPL